MHTARTIALVVVTATLTLLSVVAVATLLFGRPGLVVTLGALATTIVLYFWILQPWHRRWGTAGDEADRPLPGDELVPGGSSTTRAITIAAPPDEVWPWLVQIGWGRAGWYSYDWIDNDGLPSADVIRADLQDLAPGDRILMTPDMGFVVRELDPPHRLIALSDDGRTSWCLTVERVARGSRLISRFRAGYPLTPASAPWLAITDPGAFVMERRMLKGIAARAEAAHRGRERHVHAA